MFAILFTKAMDPFYQIILSFPTIIFSVVLIFCLLFWLVAILGFLDITFLDIPDIDSGAGEGLTADTASTPDAAAGIILKMGLNGVPITIIVSLIALIGWLISYYLVNFSNQYTPYNLDDKGILFYIASAGMFIIAFYTSTLITAQLIKPLRSLFKQMETEQNIEKIVIGQTATVRTSRVDSEFGEVIFDDGGAGLILKVRAQQGEIYQKGDKVVLLEHNKENDTFSIMSEQEFTH